MVLSRALRAEAATSLKLAVVDAVTSACVCAQRLGQLPIPAHTPYNATSTIAQTVGHVAGGGWASTAGDVGHVVGESGGGGVDSVHDRATVGVLCDAALILSSDANPQVSLLFSPHSISLSLPLSLFLSVSLQSPQSPRLSLFFALSLLPSVFSLFWEGFVGSVRQVLISVRVEILKSQLW